MRCFVFTGQGSQYLGMGKDILEKKPEYELYFDKVKNKIGLDIKSIIFGTDEKELTLTQNAQVAILTISYMKYLNALEEGLKPDVVAGHSLGEWTALLAAKMIDFEEAIEAVYYRGLYMSEAFEPGKGGMAAVIGMDLNEIEKVLSNYPNVQIANYNSPSQVVISGEMEELLISMEKLKEEGARKVVPLNVSGPFHSKFLKDAEERLRRRIEHIECKKPTVPIVQNVTAKFETDPDIIKENVIKQITSPVRWIECVEECVKNGVDEFVEIGPTKVLTKFIKQINKNVKLLNI
ncbi:malonyl CoA-ACP transacylase [Petrotoga miotherma DSM 10691]|uniref:Malonyl CoA-acyl carrier protein transacylase n=1 Tax=Petrotoga miotherma DSM 10691 TaxID=1434326 RepID=A0A2K1PGV6_9BACT|nr:MULTISPECIES: ACP S-malonyltransferase [Petrotoga]PNR92082.1 malonyl CoA-ACP transacylase [Petrotoga sp. HWHPT.55.6.3]PNS02012.1 malonyl CoA-ACP transacylase [Petrotoga miotherma DSM 10691]RPD35650.1 malonyl CoA-ACP transacylase [Petrotoga sp. HWH.PT.55.6.1]